MYKLRRCQAHTQTDRQAQEQHHGNGHIKAAMYRIIAALLLLLPYVILLGFLMTSVLRYVTYYIRRR